MANRLQSILKRGLIERFREPRELAWLIVNLNCPDLFVPTVDKYGSMGFFMQAHTHVKNPSHDSGSNYSSDSLFRMSEALYKTLAT